MPVFVAGPRITILPAFSPLAAGFDVRSGLPIEMGEVRIVAASGRRAVDLGPLAKIQRI
jgi:metallophosphoesterase superfamily enzyme